jgi:alpha-L-fucosidase
LGVQILPGARDEAAEVNVKAGRVLELLLIFVSSLSAIKCTDLGSNPDYIQNPTSLPPAFAPPLIEYYPPVPSSPQLEWENAGLAMFVHFGMNTMTDRELGSGTESPMLFNPDRLDASQWVAVARDAGFKYLVLTVKHVDGFCLWPSRYTDYSVKNSPFRGGSGDVVREFADACHREGLRFGFYLSPADRHEITYGTEGYNTFFVHQLTELLTEYGDVGEVWFDGADGVQLTGKKQPFDWNRIYATVRAYQPSALIACLGPDIRWIGQEDGIGDTTAWAPQPTFLFSPGGTLAWYPSECDVSIRPGWFYHGSEDDLLKEAGNLVDIYLKSVGRNSNLILNVPPDRHGLVSDVDASALSAWRTRLNVLFGSDLLLHRTILSSSTRENKDSFLPRNCVDGDVNTFWAADEGVLSAQITVELGGTQQINAVRLEEAIRYGQRIRAFTLYADNAGLWSLIASGTTVGRTRILTFPTVATTRLRLSIDDAKASPTLRTFSAYLFPPY